MKEGGGGGKRGHFPYKPDVSHVSLNIGKEGGGGGAGTLYCFDRMSRISNQVFEIRKKFKIIAIMIVLIF